MRSIQFAFTGYAIIGLTLFILAASIAIYMLRLRPKTRATRALIAFFIFVAFSGAATILKNGLVFWSEIFAPWQDFWILAGGLALVQFAYRLTDDDKTWEAKAVTAGLSIMIIGGFFYCLLYSFRYISQWTLDLDVSDLYYLLLPIGTLLVVIIFLARSIELSKRADGSAKRNIIGDLIRPSGTEAGILRNLALALCLAFLPGLQTIISFPDPYGFILSNLGSLLAIIAITLVYFNYAPEVDSFLAKLVGITLVTVLLIFSIFGSIFVYTAERERSPSQIEILTDVYEAIVRGEEIRGLHNLAAYVISWPAADPQDENAYEELYRGSNQWPINLEELLAGNGGADFDSWSLRNGGPLIDLTNHDWWFKSRSLKAPEIYFWEEYRSYFFTHEDRAYEIGISHSVYEGMVSQDVTKWLLMILISSGLVLLVFPQFYKRNLVKPLQNLLAGIRLVNAGELDTAVPIQYRDEIGFLTQSFNELTRSLSRSREEEGRLFAELQGSLVELKEEIDERNRLGRNLHDSVTQLLYSMTLFSGSAREALEDGDQERLHRSVNNLSETATHALREMRFLLFELQPPAPEDLGLKRALQARLDMVETRVGITVEMEIDKELQNNAEIDHELYYVAIEALNNVFKHARADEVKLTIQPQNGSICLVVSDNGLGFEIEKVDFGFGLKSMEQRVGLLGGNLMIVSQPGKGTRIRAEVPNGKMNG